MFTRMFFAAVSFAFVSACHSLSIPEDAERRHPAYFISIDGAKPEHLRAFLDAGVLPDDQGLGALIRTGQVSYQASADGISLTAPSHVSMITCAPPSAHGIIANKYFARNPETHRLEPRDGFATPFAPEPFWKTARRHGKRVLSLGYVGSANGTSDDQPDVWIGFPPPGKLVKGHVETLRWSKLSPAKDWVLPGELANLHLPSAQAKEATLTLQLSPETSETRTINVLILNSPQPQIYFDDDKDLANGHYGVLTENHPGFVDFFFTELNPRSSTREYKRHIYVRWLQEAHADEIRLAVSASTFNYAYPESFRKNLDRTNLVFPDPVTPNPFAEKTGVTPLEFVEWNYRLNRFLVDAYEVAQHDGPFDLVLFYQQMLDVYGHVYESRLPSPFDPSQPSPVMEGYKLAVRLINHNVNDLIKNDIGKSPIVLVSDHGMESLDAEVNLARALPTLPKEITFQTAGGSLLIYSDLAPDKWKAWYERTISKLQDLRNKNLPVLGSHVERADDHTPWNYGDAQAVLFAAPHLQFGYNPDHVKIFDAPKNNGTHGYPISDPEMNAIFVKNGPGVPAGLLPATTLRDAIPTLAQMMNVPPPGQCVGHALKSFVPPENQNVVTMTRETKETP